MNAPSVSVILPTYNRAPLLGRSVHSVLNQTYTDLELIVVDDCSTDNTQQELSKIVDPRLRVIRQAINSGPSAARNRGIRAATGRYIAFQDSDDVWFPSKLQKQISLISKGDVNGIYPAACYSRYAVSCNKKAILVPQDPEASLSGNIYVRLLYGNTMGTPVMLVKKEVLEAVGGFDESLANLEDWDMALRLSINHPIAFLDEVTLTVYDSPNSVNKRLAPQSLITIFEKHADAYATHPKAMADITWRIGYEYAMRRERYRALRYMDLSLKQQVTPVRQLQFAALRAGMTPYMALSHVRRFLRH